MSIAITLKKVHKNFKIKREDDKSLFGSLRDSLYLKNCYEKIHALKSIDLEVKKGEILGVIGPNGAGKTTFLQIIAGIMRCTKGKVLTKGSILPIIELGSDINPELTGKENIFLSGVVMGLPRRFIKRKYKELVDFSGLKKFINVKTKNYSSGMRMRLAFSILLLSNPDIILIDEVLGVGDIRFQKKCFEKLKKWSNEKKTIVFVSQDMTSIKKFCDKAIFLNKGSIVGYGNSSMVVKKYLMMNVSSEKDLYYEWGSKDIEITSVKLLVSKGEEKDSFKQGEKMIIEIGYDNKNNVKNPMFGIAIHADDMLVWGPNTTSSRALPKSLKKKGTISLVIDNIPFSSGKLFLTVAIHDYSGKELYHRKEKLLFFFVDHGLKKSNFLNLKYNWVFR